MLGERVLTLLRGLFGRERRNDPLAALAAFDPAQVRVVVGLGNPGPTYADTRHNVGFRCVDLLAERFGAAWVDDQERTSARVTLAQAGEHPLLLAKPQTFMNASGKAVRALCELVEEPRHVLVVYDDMDLPLGTLRLRSRGSAGTHNGMRSIVRELGTEQFPRLRIGIGQAGQQDAIDHVLGTFSPTENAQLGLLLERAADAALTWVIDGPEAAMNRYNR